MKAISLLERYVYVCFVHLESPAAQKGAWCVTLVMTRPINCYRHLIEGKINLLPSQLMKIVLSFLAIIVSTKLKVNRKQMNRPIHYHTWLSSCFAKGHKRCIMQKANKARTVQKKKKKNHRAFAFRLHTAKHMHLGPVYSSLWNACLFVHNLSSCGCHL